MYYKQINGIRAFAVFGPLLVHLWPHDAPNTPWTAATAHLGSFGVDLFFVISGFLITGILLHSRTRIQEQQSTIGQSLAIFYIRRSIRIFPIYYLLLTVLLVLGLKELQEHAGWYYAYLANFRIMDIGRWPGTLSHLWSLSVEEQFYLAWPFLVLTTPQRWLRHLFLLLFISGPLFRVAMVLLGANSIAVGVPPIACLDPLAGGALLALWMEQDKERRHYGKLRAIGMIGTLFTVIQALNYIIILHGGPISSQLPFMRLTATLAFMWLIGAAALERSGALGQVLLARPFEYIGRISYGIYLYHLVIPWFLASVVGIHLGRSVGSFLITAVLTMALASASWHLIEKPINKLKRFAPNL